MPSDRGVSSVISVILMVAIVVILAATVSVFVLDVGEEITEPVPNIADTTGEFVIDAPNARDNQLVRITHAGGDDVAVEELELIVRASGPNVDTEARLVNLPADGLSFEHQNLEDPNNLVDDGDSTKNNIIISDGVDTWSAGDTIQFRINVGAADFRVDENNTGPVADTLTVVIVHSPSNAIISQNTFTPRSN